MNGNVETFNSADDCVQASPDEMVQSGSDKDTKNSLCIFSFA